MGSYAYTPWSIFEGVDPKFIDIDINGVPIVNMEIIK